jgi:hypothetical protein
MNSKYFNVSAYGTTWTVRVESSKYRVNDRAALMLVCRDGIPFAKLTVNIPSLELAENEFAVKSWDGQDQFLDTVLDQGLFEDTGRRVANEFGAVAQVWRFINH